MAISNFKFYDKLGNNITPRYDNGVFYLDLYFNNVSVNLFETQHVFIFEEIFKQYNLNDINEDSIKNSIIEPPLIRFLEILNTYTNSIKSNKLQSVFVNDSIYIDEVDNFAIKNSNYINRELINNEFHYSITFAGKSYLTEYREEQQNDTLFKQGLKNVLVRPRANYNSEFNEDTYFYFKWKNNPEYDKNIFTFLVDLNDTTKYYSKHKESCDNKPKTIPGLIPLYDEYLKININSNPDWKNIFIPFRFDDGRDDSYTDNNIQKRRILSQDKELNQNPIQFNFAINSNIEGYFNRTLEIYIVRKGNKLKDINGDTEYELTTATYKIAEINLYGEVIGEDERFKILLENFGRKINESETYVFRDVDVEEDLPNYIKINEKRKELLLISNEIYPYLGSYKAFTNAMKWLGYSDLRIKEYFYNVKLSDPSKYKSYYSSVEIPMDLKRNLEFNKNLTYNEMVYGELINSPDYKKTARFGLYYDINKVTDDYDEFGFPIVVDNFQFTASEVLIKLFGLKNLLQKYFLPHHARIIDITGEGVYFGKFTVSTWTKLTPIIPLILGHNPEFIGKPLVGYIKPLDKLLTLYKFKNQIFEEKTIDPDSLLTDILSDSISQYIDGNVDFVFQEELPYEEIIKYYDNYEELKNDIIEHLQNSKCEEDYQTNTLNFFYSYSKMLGQPVELELLKNSVTWNDLGVEWYKADSVPPDAIIRYPKKADIKIDEYRISENLVGKDAKSPLYTWESLGFFDGFEMEWRITHVNNSYCYVKKGLIRDISKIIAYLPYVGKYNVTCIIKDITGFPNITRKNEYLEVLHPGIDIVAFGRFVEENTDATWNYNLDNIDTKRCPLDTTWDDAKISWSSLNYENYMVQDFTLNDIQSDEILDINYDLNYIIIKGKDFYDDYVLNKNIKHRKNIVVYKSPDDEQSYYNIDILEIKKNTIILNGIYSIKEKEKINLYKQYRTDDFIINKNTIRIFNNIYDFQIGTSIKLLQENFELGNKHNYYEIIDIIENLELGYTDVIIDDDGSLNFLPSPELDTTLKYNYNLWNYIEFKEEDTVFNVSTVYMDKTNNKTILTVSNYKSLSYYKDIDLSDYKIETNIFNGWYVFNVSDFTVNLTSDSNTKIDIINNKNELCNIDINFKAYWTEYDLDWAIKYGNTKNINWDKTLVRWEDMKHLTWDMLEYHGNSILGFKIWNIEKLIPSTYINNEIVSSNFSIKFNGHEAIFNLGNLPSITDSNISVNQSIVEWKNKQVLDLLNNSNDEWVSKFKYHNVLNEYIQAVSKDSNINCLCQLEYTGGIIGTKDTYPRAFYSNYEMTFHKGENNPPLWNYLKRGLFENNDIYINKDNDIDYTLKFDNYVNGSFTFNDTFIRTKDFEIPKFTQVFITISDMFNLSDDVKYEWELWEELNNTLLIKSAYKYIIWSFVNEGVYTIKLKIIDTQFGEHSVEKKSWITVK